MSTYNYSISNDFPNGLAADRLVNEIRDSSIVTALDSIDTSGDNCVISFKASLSGGDETTLDSLVANHSGEPLPNDIPTPVKLYSDVGTPAPQTSDGKPIILSNMFPGNVLVYFCGAGDDSVLGRGKGSQFNIQRSEAGDSTVEWNFLDWIYLAGGGFTSISADLGDYIDMELYVPATPVVANVGNTGNCNLVSGVVIIPAAGNGAYDVDLSIANLVPVDPDEDGIGSGFWSWSTPDTGRGIITPGTPGQAPYHLLTVVQPLARFVNKMQLLSGITANLTIPAVKPKKILPHWKIKVMLHNEGGNHTIKLAWYLTSARVQTI